MSSVVIDRKTLERVRSVVADAFIHTWVQRELLAALDAALSAPEPWVEDGELRVEWGDSTYEISRYVEGSVHIWCWDYYLMLPTRECTYAVALALLALTEEGP